MLKPFTFEDPKIEMEGSLTFDLGITATIAWEYGAGIAGVKAGFGIGLIPLSAKFEAKAGKKFCTEFSLGAKVEISLVAEAWILRRSWGVSYNGDLFEKRFVYPGMQLTLPRGC